MLSPNPQNIDALLEKCLDRVLNGQETIDSVVNDFPAQADELRSCLEAALWLIAQKSTLEPSQEFINTSSRHLIARMEREQKSKKESRRSKAPFWQNLFKSRNLAFQLAFVLLLACSTLFFASNVALASQNALPGDFLYSVKTSLETAQLAITFSPVDQAELHMVFADRRLAEIQTLTAQEKYDDFEIAIDNLDRHVTQALQILQFETEKDSLQTRELAMNVQQALLKQEQTLTYLKSKAPSKNQAALQQTLELSVQGAGIAQKVIEESGGPALAATPTTNTESIAPTDTDTPLPSDTPSTVITLTALPSDTLTTPSPTGIITTPQAATTLSAEKTQKPKNTNKPTQKPKPTKKPTKTPKPPKPTKTPK